MIADRVEGVLRDNPEWVCTVCGWRPQHGPAPAKSRSPGGYCVHTGRSAIGCVHGRDHNHPYISKCACMCHIEIDDKTMEQVRESLQRIAAHRATL